MAHAAQRTARDIRVRRTPQSTTKWKSDPFAYLQSRKCSSTHPQFMPYPTRRPALTSKARREKCSTSNRAHRVHNCALLVSKYYAKARMIGSSKPQAKRPTRIEQIRKVPRPSKAAAPSTTPIKSHKTSRTAYHGETTRSSSSLSAKPTSKTGRTKNSLSSSRIDPRAETNLDNARYSRKRRQIFKWKMGSTTSRDSRHLTK